MRRVFLIGIFLCAWIALGAGAADSAMPPLSNRDCVKCHPAEADEIDARGASHKTEVGCIDCHPQHPPVGKKTVLPCADCHSPQKSAHYALKKCRDCHEPHAPSETDLSKIDSVKLACVSCHAEPQEQMKAFPTAHADMDCKECHAQHPQSASCMDCHESHGKDIAAGDCQLCHKPHRPMPLLYDGPVPTRLCSPCHEDAIKVLEEKGGAHKEVECADCHQKHPPETDGVMPGCDQCHPPEDSSHYASSKCSACHKPHIPEEVLYAADTPSEFCTGCHAAEGVKLSRTSTRHGNLACAYCHKERHGSVFECGVCHGEPHDFKLHANYPKCATCHKDAHALMR